MLCTIVWVGVLVGTLVLALMAWLLWASFKAEDRQHLAELNEEYKELLQQEGRQDW
jgi:protein-S-isoprenylcysteine O-methyltransferase Ste14